MKIAIMGAGLSGLACAITLEQNGLTPTIFEKRSMVGDRFVNGEIFLDALSSPIKDSFEYLSQEWNIYLQPIGHIKKLIVYSENEKAIVKGNIGFNNLRGRRNDSLSNQLVKQVKSQIIYNSTYSYEDLLKEFTHIVLATGDASYSEKMLNFNKSFTVSLKGAIVEGDFNRYSAMTWLNNDFAPKGYSYLIPLSENEANIVIAYPDYPENAILDINELWNKFYNRVKKDLKQDLRITDNFQIRKYIIGHCLEPRIGNTFFVGNCYGSIMPFLGFGQITSILSGIYAALDLCGKGRYEKLVKKLDKSYENSLVLRKGMEKLDNHNFDTLVKALNTNIGNKIVDSNSLNYLSIISNLLKPLINT